MLNQLNWMLMRSYLKWGLEWINNNIFRGVAERLNAAVLKTVLLKGNGGSNPSSSAKIARWQMVSQLLRGLFHISCNGEYRFDSCPGFK